MESVVFESIKPHFHACGCGIADRPHVTGEHGCPRYMVDAPQPAPLHLVLNCPMWHVGDSDGEAITDYTLRYQRGYHQHPCGCWSRHPDNVNSIED